MNDADRPSRPVRRQTPRRHDLLQGSLRLKQWVLGSPRVRIGVLRRALLHWNAHWFERHWADQAARSADVDLPDDPVILIGLWRTGTTRLHARLHEATGWTSPTTWQCFHPAVFSMLPPPAPKRGVQRPMDATVITPDSPQEDEFAALLLGENSVYRSFIDPSRMDEATALLNAWRDTTPVPNDTVLSPRWERFLAAVLRARPGTLLLKSPNHTFRLPALAERFPRARFVWLHRNAADVRQSILNMWQQMMALHGFTTPDSAELHRFVDTALATHTDIRGWAETHIRHRLWDVRFEDAVADDGGWLRRLIGELEAGNRSGSDWRLGDTNSIP